MAWREDILRAELAQEFAGLTKLELKDEGGLSFRRTRADYMRERRKDPLFREKERATAKERLATDLEYRARRNAQKVESRDPEQHKAYMRARRQDPAIRARDLPADAARQRAKRAAARAAQQEQPCAS